jgi:succinoglycan biosynthesis protein ExoO
MIALAARSGADVVLGNVAEVRSPGETMGGAPLLSPDRPAAPLPARAFLEGNLRATGGRTLGYLKPLLRRDFVERRGLRYDETLRNGEDCHLVLSAYLAGARVWLHAAPDYAYLRRAGSLSARSKPAHLEALLAAEARMAPALEALPGQGMGPLLRMRRRALRRVMTTERAMQALRRGSARAALRALLEHPAALPRMALQLAEAAGKRRPRLPGTRP